MQSSTQQRVVFAGSPGAGKTSVLEALSGLGYKTGQDAAREIIRARKLRGKSPRPEATEFAKQILTREIASYAAVEDGFTFFERSIVDVAGMLLSLKVFDEAGVQEIINEYPYYPKVFMFAPWEGIYEMDGERDESFEHAVSVYEPTLKWYERHGYDCVLVPFVSVPERVDFILGECI